MIDSNPLRQVETTSTTALPTLDLVVVEADSEATVKDAAHLAIHLLDAHARVRAVGVGAEQHDGNRPGALRAAIDALVDCDCAYGWPPYRVGGRRAAVLLLSDGRRRSDFRRAVDRQQRDELLATGGLCDLLAARGCAVYTVDVAGAGHDGEVAGLLREVAASTRGRSFVATTTRALRDACARVIEELSD